MSYVGLDIARCSELKAHLDQAAADLYAHADTVQALLNQAGIVSCKAPAELRDVAAWANYRSRDLQNTFGGAGSNINLVPAGAMLNADNPGTANADKYRPLQGYGDLNQATNNLYSNYNALQVSWARHAGLYTIQTNYTWQKALGIVAPTLNPFNLRADYGILPSDRRHLFNIAYSIDLGNRVHVNSFVNGALNGWQFSGITQAQSGANITYGGNYNPNNPANSNYNMSLSCVPTAAEAAAGITCAQSAAIIPGSKSATNPKGIPINNQSILGTNGAQLSPLVTCNPSAKSGSHVYANASCFAAPTTPGHGGPALLPVSYGPAFVNSDLAVFKNFQMTEKMKLQFRVQAYNFLNHPLYSFPSGSALTLQYTQDPVTEQFTQANGNFATTTQKQGQRIMEFAAKFYF